MTRGKSITKAVKTPSSESKPFTETWAIFLLLMPFYGLLIFDLLAALAEGLFIRAITSLTIRDKKLIM